MIHFVTKKAFVLPANLHDNFQFTQRHDKIRLSRTGIPQRLIFFYPIRKMRSVLLRRGISTSVRIFWLSFGCRKERSDARFETKTDVQMQIDTDKYDKPLPKFPKLLFYNKT